MNLSDSDIIAMTAANFSYETDPRNPEAVYQGASIYTRCVWEIKLGNAVSTNISTRIADDRPLTVPWRAQWWQDLCVGDFWESEERRALTTFTSAIYVDKLMLVTMLKPLPTSYFTFPVEFDSSRLHRTQLLHRT
jgi:hypothetical protein